MTRIPLTDNRFAIWLEEVDGLCPLCRKELVDYTTKAIYKRCEAAHIYPHSPTFEEIKLLKDVPRLSDNAENLDNIILLCLSCHDKFDNPRTVEGYMELYYIKKQIINNNKAKKYYSRHMIEEDIVGILEMLCNIDDVEKLPKLSYDALEIYKKIEPRMPPIFKKHIERNVVTYYRTIKNSLVEIEKDSFGISEQIASEIKLCYMDFFNQGLTQIEIYDNLINWLKKQTLDKYPYAVDIVISYFVQNCEVFS